jgi:phosphoglycolate phosphatase
MSDRVFIFDFDGTIADTHRFIVDISNRLAEEFNYNVIAPEEVEQLKDKTSREIIRYLQVPIFKIPAILSKAKKELYEGIAGIKPIAGLKEILQLLDDDDVKMGILSSNATQNISTFLRNNDLEVFDFVDSTVKVWTKNTSLQKLIDRYGFQPEQIIYIGDEVRDIEAAKKLRIKVAAVTWGYNSTKALAEHKPDFLIHTPQELYELCKAFSKET